KGNNIFLSYGNLLDVLRQVSITGLIATGMTGVILTAGIDLSVGAIMAVCSVVWGVLLVTPCVGLLFGTINGIIIVAGRLQPFIVTLAMMVTALGIARLTAGQNNAVLPVYTGSNAVAEFDNLRSLVFGVVPMPGLFFIVAIVVYGAVLRLTPFGRYVYAIGGNEEAA